MQNIKITIKGIIFLMGFVLLLVAFTFVLRDKTCAEEYFPFFKENVDYDVYIIGTSVARGGVSPLDLWHQYGITSYNLAMSGQTLPLNYYSLKSAININKPKVVIADLSYIYLEEQSLTEGRIHQLIDNMPFSSDKLKTIEKLVKPSEWQYYLFNILYYHERWKELSPKDFTKINSLNKGCVLGSITNDSEGNYFNPETKFAEPLSILPKEEKTELSADTKEWILKIIDLCKQENIELIFIAFPTYAQGETGSHGDGYKLQRLWNHFYDIAIEYNVEYINYMHELDRISFDYQNDLVDYYHLAYTGAEKITNDLGQLLVQKYKLEDRRNDNLLASWNEQWKELDE